MHCPYLDFIRTNMYNQISELELATNSPILANSQNIYSLLLGKVPDMIQEEVCSGFLKIVAQNVHSMYRIVLNNRVSVG